MTTNDAEAPRVPFDEDDPSLDELARRQGVRPVHDVHDMARPGVFRSDQELEEFIAHVAASRQADLA